jgi:arylsulfatase A-like enzyme
MGQCSRASLPRDTLRLALFAALSVLACTTATCSRPPARPSVLILVADSLAARSVSAYGCERATTPHFDRFAAQGVRFERAYAQSAWTLPSVASLLTSRAEHDHGVVDLDRRLGHDVPTMAEAFRAAGYRTCALVQTPVLGSRTGLGRGFDEYRVLDLDRVGFDAALVRARELWTGAGTQPLFCYVHVTPPHMPYQPPPPFRGRFVAEDPKQRVDGSIASARAIHRSGLAPQHPDVQRLKAQYEEHVAYADARLGALLDELGNSERAARAIVVWTSDHGEAFMEHGAQGHNATVFEEMVRVPLAIQSRGAALAPRVEPAPASLLDVWPTLSELCDVARPPSAGGSSLVAALRGTSRAPDERVLELASRAYARKPELQQLAVVRGRWKLFHDAASGGTSLYDLELDPGELADAAGQHPEVVRALAPRLASLRDAHTAMLRRPSDGTWPSPGERRSLAEVGYTDD